MMGLNVRAFAPLVAVSLEELVPDDHYYCYFPIEGEASLE